MTGPRSAAAEGDAAADAAGNTELSASRKWLLTFSVMVVAVMQVLDTSVTNVALPHMQGSLSASVEEVAWVITSYLAANAVVIPATGWLTAYFGRRKFFLVCTVLFTLSSFLSGIAPNLETLVLMRVFQGLGGGPVIPMSQAILWEIFPLHQRGLAMAMWGVGIMMGPIFGPTVGGWIADNWSWRWIFYVNLPIGLLGFLLASAFLIDSPHVRKPGRIDVAGLVLMIVGFGCLQLTLDWGEREDWFDSRLIVNLGVVAVCGLGAFVWRELAVKDPIMDFTVFANRNFALGTTFIATAVFTFYSSMLLLALYTQKLLGYDAWSSGAVLAPGGIGNLFSLLIAGRLVARVDQRWLLGLGLVLNGIALYWMSNLTLGVDYWSLVWPRFAQGFGMGFIFLPLTTLSISTIPKARLPNATAAFNLIRNMGGSPHHHAACPPQPVPPGHAGRPRRRVGPGDDRQAGALDGALPVPRHRRLHRPDAGDRDGVPGDGDAGPGAGLRRRVPPALRNLLRDARPHPVHAPRPGRAAAEGRAGRARRGAACGRGHARSIAAVK